MMRRHLLLLVTTGVLALGLGGALVWFATSGDTERRAAALGATDETTPGSSVVAGCVDEQGSLRIVDPTKVCQAAETSLNWLSVEKTGAYTLWVSPLASPLRGLIGCTSHGGGASVYSLFNQQCDAHSSEMSVPLALPDGWKIERLTVCYRTTNARSYINTLELRRVTVPGAATTVHSDGTNLTSTTGECADSTPGSPVSIDGAMSLRVDVWFGARNDRIDIGGIGLHLAPF